MTEPDFHRLSDRVLDALEMAVEQKDRNIAEILARALEMALTRGAGGKDFVERRDFDARVGAALGAIEGLRKG